MCLELVVLLRVSRVSSEVKTVHAGHLLVYTAMIFYHNFVGHVRDIVLARCNIHGMDLDYMLKDI